MTDDLLSAEYTPEQKREIESLRSRINVARRILSARVAMGLTQGELGRQAGTKQSRVSDLELMNGNLRFDTLDRIARVLNLMITLVPRPIAERRGETWATSFVVPIEREPGEMSPLERLFGLYDECFVHALTVAKEHPEAKMTGSDIVAAAATAFIQAARAGI